MFTLRRLCATTSSLCSATTLRSPQWLSQTLFRSMSTEVGDGYSHTVTLFTKEGCSLCEPVKEAILAAQAEFNNFRYVEAHINHDAWKDKYYKLYRWEIPVVHIDGVEYCRHRMEDPEDFFETIKQLK